MKSMRSILLTCLLIVAPYEALRISRLVPDGLLPAISEIGTEMIRDRSRLISAMFATEISVLLSIVVTIPLSIGMAVLMNMKRDIRDILMPLLITLKSLPAVALLPLLVLLIKRPLWIQVALTVAICFLPLTLAGYSGLKSATGGLRHFALATAGDRRRIFWLVTVPAAVNELLLGMKLTLPLAFVGTLVAEMSSGTSGGIGNLILTANNYSDFKRMFAAVIVVAVVSTASYMTLVVSIRKIFPASREAWL